MAIDNNNWGNVLPLVKTITMLCRCQPIANKAIHKAFNTLRIYTCCKLQRIGKK